MNRPLATLIALCIAGSALADDRRARDVAIDNWSTLRAVSGALKFRASACDAAMAVGELQPCEVFFQYAGEAIYRVRDANHAIQALPAGLRNELVPASEYREAASQVAYARKVLEVYGEIRKSE